MSKEERLQLRMEKKLKEWFRSFSEGRGGMSRIVVDYVMALQKADEEEDGSESQPRT